MGRRLTGKLVLATHNNGKLAEFQALMAPYGVDVVSVGQLGLPVPEETGTTFVENARIKALAALEATGLPALADDSGLCIEALGGAPGVYTADWAGPTRSWDVAMQRAQDELLAVGATTPDQRRGTFVSVLTLVWPDGHSETFEGRAGGTLVWPTRGAHGHGYDPMFQPDGSNQTFAQMPEAEKNTISHRARSFQQLAKACLGATAS
jgi:XTP/dITP diphosphohydrolase